MDAFEKFMKQALESESPMPRQGPGPDCPGEEDLGCFLEGSGTKEERTTIESHLGDCEYCLDSIEIYLQAHAAPEEVPALSPEVREAEEQILYEAAASAAPREDTGTARRAPTQTGLEARSSIWDRLLARIRLIVDEATDRLRIFPQPSYAFATVAAAALVCLVVITKFTTGPLTGPNSLDLSAFGVHQAVVRATGAEGETMVEGAVGRDDYLRIDIPLADPSGRLTGLFIDASGVPVEVMKIDFEEGGPSSFTVSTDRRKAEVGVDIGETSVLVEAPASRLLGDHYGPIRILLVLEKDPVREGMAEELIQAVRGAGDRPKQWEEVVLEWGKGKIKHYGLDEIDYRVGGEMP